MNQYAFLDDTGSYSAVIDSQRVSDRSAEKIAESRRLLQDPYAYFNEFGGYSAAEDSRWPQQNAHVEFPRNLTEKYSSLLRNKQKNRRYSDSEIEAKAIEVQRMMWLDKDQIWPDALPSNPICVLDPATAFRLFDFDFDLEESLGQYFNDGKQLEVAGIIDDSSRRVRISRKFPPHVRSFTAAHELGHALLHEARGLHRDRPLDGTCISREHIEREADKFASYFLMPGKLIRASFETHFGTSQFLLNDDTGFALSRGTTLDLKGGCRSLRDLSRILASAESYNGLRFDSLASQFRVSVEAMAIRIEELELVAW